MRKIYLITLMLLSFNCIQAQTVLLTENFNYPADSALQSNGWFAHSAGGTNPIKVTNGGLGWTASNYLGSNIGNAAAVNNTGSDENRPFSSYPNSGNIYVSLLAKVDTSSAVSSGYFLHIGAYNDTINPVFTSVSTNFRARTYVVQGSNASKFRFGLTFNSGTVPSTVGTDLTNDLDTGTTYLVVVKYSFHPGVDNDSVSLYLFSEGDSIDTEPSTPTIGPLAGTASDMTYGQYVALRQYNAGQRVTVDGIIAQTSWNMTSIVGGVNDLNQENSFSLYPNPAQDKITLQWDAQALGIQNLTIFTSLGQLVYQETFDLNNTIEHFINLPELSNGLYSVVVDYKNKRSRIPLLIAK